jgi:hypothetical protein
VGQCCWPGALERGASARTGSLALGKRHFDQKEFAPAAADFEMALTLLRNPILETSVVESLSDVATLSEGFLDLSRVAMARTPAPISSKPPSVAGAAPVAGGPSRDQRRSLRPALRRGTPRHEYTMTAATVVRSAAA